MSVTSSRTPATEENSCRTLSIWTEVMAPPCSEDISTRRDWRRKGVARALIVESLKLHEALGMTAAALHVDTENPTGALKVYEDCGYRPVKTEIVYRRPLSDG